MASCGFERNSLMFCMVPGGLLDVLVDGRSQRKSQHAGPMQGSRPPRSKVVDGQHRAYYTFSDVSSLVLSKSAKDIRFNLVFRNFNESATSRITDDDVTKVRGPFYK